MNSKPCRVSTMTSWMPCTTLWWSFLYDWAARCEDLWQSKRVQCMSLLWNRMHPWSWNRRTSPVEQELKEWSQPARAKWFLCPRTLHVTWGGCETRWSASAWRECKENTCSCPFLGKAPWPTAPSCFNVGACAKLCCLCKVLWLIVHRLLRWLESCTIHVAVYIPESIRV